MVEETSAHPANSAVMSLKMSKRGVESEVEVEREAEEKRTADVLLRERMPGSRG